MKFHRSIRFRFSIALVVYSIVVTLVISNAINFLQRPVIDEFYRQQLTSELDFFSQRFQTKAAVPLPNSRYIRSYLGVEQLPDDTRPSLRKLEDGIYFESHDEREWLGNIDRNHGLWIHIKNKFQREDRNEGESPSLAVVGIKTLSDGSRLFMIAETDDMALYFKRVKKYTAYGLISFCLIGLVLALVLSHKVTAPLKKLSGMLEKAGPDDLPTGFSRRFPKDEFGILARALERSMERVNVFIKREHRFTRDASHELRTPVTVFKGAIELLRTKLPTDDEHTGKIIKRAEISVRDMELTIETLLWLAREKHNSDQIEACHVKTQVEIAAEQNKHLVDKKPVELIIVYESDPVIELPPGSLTMAISNLIRNAAQFTIQGSIKILLKEDRVIVIDTGCGIDMSHQDDITSPGVKGKYSVGYGFGLDIVRRLCDRFGWELVIDSAIGTGTTVQLIFAC